MSSSKNGALPLEILEEQVNGWLQKNESLRPTRASLAAAFCFLTAQKMWGRGAILLAIRMTVSSGSCLTVP
jgi:hypothetical protein